MERYQQLAGGSEQLESQLPDSLDEYINAEVVLRTIKDTATAVTWLRSTFLSIRVQSAGHVCCNLLAGQGQPAHKLPCTPDDKPALPSSALPAGLHADFGSESRAWGKTAHSRMSSAYAS